ncbi:MAG: Nramp family divalent metal transporter [Bacteriovoracaceae bacterium]|nr:Nramp family divalent metal transporter [Bacteriovoracaceae bacterium]
MIGPGIIIAATGVGAGDLVASTVAGAKYGYAIAWTILLGSILKLVLTDGIARYQIETGHSLIEGWSRHFPRIFQYYFLIYLLI